MKQIEFDELFKRANYQPLKYSLRPDSNGRHDAIFLDSYLHDARIHLAEMVWQKHKLTIPLDRTCWELFGVEKVGDELHGCKSKLIFFDVIDSRYCFRHGFLTERKIPDIVDITDFTVQVAPKTITVQLALNIIPEYPEFELNVILKRTAKKCLSLLDDAATFVE